ncbi:caspase-10 isoform X1 [Zalophus californianus]|uniref:Caspase-10 isoform X1 n=1 Tax=Zalophus californianus TaxID=9704 RepID=A0A6J2CQM3_ZALCA|nr:caspase-10 isoform X1 [Zalophus californianus]XP_027978117.1 caspase-10 isoform X1 [Eumetopias jubatus]
MTSQDQNSGFRSDDNGQSSFLGKLLTIDSKLGNQDVEGLKFLCRDCISHRQLEKSSSASDIFDHLLEEELLSEEDPFFLAELLYIIKQKSLLRYLNQSKEQVESLLPTRGRVSLFRNLLYELSESIGSENLKDMIFLLRESIPKIQMTSLGFLAYLEKQGLIDEDNLRLLEDLCRRVVPNLMRKIEKYKREKASQVVTPPVDREPESLHQRKEEPFSRSDIEELLEALPALPKASVYRMDRKHRGHCVVVNNHKFTSMSDRPGTDKDAEHLRHVFEWLGFSVRVYDNVTKGHLDNVLQEYKCHPGHSDGDCFVFCVLTHGKFGAVYSSDGTLVPIQEIMSHFTAQQCPGLAHKPKLFFIQACQGEEIQPPVFIEADAVNPERVPPSLQDSIPDEADFLLGLATVPGYVSFRHVEKGSWYIQSLCNHLKSLVPRNEDILSILTAVNNDVSQQADREGTKKQMPQPAFTLRKKLVFPVPQEKL